MSASGGPSGGPLGLPGDRLWEAVEAQLASLPQDYTDPKFYALKHVVEILSSNQPQALVEEVSWGRCTGRRGPQHNCAPRARRSARGAFAHSRSWRRAQPPCRPARAPHHSCALRRAS